MNIALIGYGKMGKAIEKRGSTGGFRFPVRIDLDNREDLNPETLSRADVAIEFSSPGAAPENLRACIDAGLPVVSGTTGWNRHMEEITRYCRKHGGALFYASNFSIGVNILFALNRQLARIMDRFPEYSPSIEEVHHTQKLDAPSGTAITLAEQITEASERIRGWAPGGDARKDELPVNSIREGDVKGIHRVSYASELDTLQLVHSAHTRDAFVNGALLAARFIRGRTGVFGMKDLLEF